MTRSIGDILKKTREKRNLTVEDVYKTIKIHPNYIKALEANDFSAFSGKVHSKGFLKLYAEYLGLNVTEMMALWRREYEQTFETRKEEKFFQKRSVDVPRFIITPYIIFIFSIVLAIFVFFSYLYFQYRTFTGAPKLVLYYPPDNLVTKEDILDITGKTDLDSEVFLNNQKIILAPDGSFAQSIRLKEGLNTVSIRSENKLLKETSFVRTIIYRPDKVEPALDTPETTESTKSNKTSQDKP